MFGSLHNHSCYSLLDSISKTEDMWRKAKELNYSALAITDHGNFHNVINFYKEGLKYPEIKTILGIELYECNDINVKDTDRFHLIALAKNNKGLEALYKISTESYLKGYYYKPRCDIETIKPYADDIIILSGCMAGRLSRILVNEGYDKTREWIYKYKEAFPNYYIELQSHNTKEQVALNNLLLELAEETNTPYVITLDTHMIEEKDLEAHAVFIQISQDREVGESYSDCYFQSEEKIHEIMDTQIGEDKVNIALDNTNKITEICNVEITLNQPELPHFPIPSSYKNEEEYFKYLINEGFKEKQLNKLPKEQRQKYIDRIEYEYNILKPKGFLGYFLVVYDFLHWAKENDILTGAGRGSAAGSLISYLLDITKLDPLEYNLLFERFLNPERTALPDIDNDIDSAKRSLVINYLREKYGTENVCQIGNFQTLASKAAIKDVSKVLEIPYEVSNNIARFIPDNTTLEEVLKSNPSIKQLRNQYPKLFEYAIKLEGLPKSYSVHPCGVVIGAKPLNHYTALALSKEKEEVLHLEMHQTEEVGLVKLDVLGIETLSLIDNTLKMINKKYEDILHPDVLDFQNEKTWELLQKAETEGVFQLSSPGMKSIILRMNPTKMADISAINALYRPDSMKLLEEFIENKNNPNNIKYLHPDMESILKDDYGCCIYQERLMEITKVFGGYSDGEADLFRKGIGKKDKDLVKKEAENLRRRIVEKGYSEEIANTLADDMAEKGGYMFNLSHSFSYSILGYQTAYLKANYPLEFTCCLLNNEKGNYQQLGKYINECTRMNIKVLPPSINKSTTEFTISQDNILFGLGMIKGVGNKVDAILKNRLYTSFEDFLEKTKDENTDLTSNIALIKSGAFNEFNDNKNNLLIEYGKTLLSPLNFKPNKTISTKQKKILLEEGLILENDWKENKDYCLEVYNKFKKSNTEKENKQRLEKHLKEFKEKYMSDNIADYEMESLSMYLTTSPFKDAKKYLKPFDELKEKTEQLLFGTIIDIKYKNDKRRQRFAYVDLLNQEDKIIEVIVWASVYSQFQPLIKKGNKIVMLGKRDESKFMASKIKLYENWLDNIKEGHKNEEQGSSNDE